jgi:multimeric flavodoxin WrbA/nitrite reductase/ring-hydroxylating ferredoxin subunit
MTAEWVDLGRADELKVRTLQPVMAGRRKLALIFKDGQWSALDGKCNHVGGPLGEGVLEGDFVVCPWHQYRFHCRTGEGEPGFEDDKVPSYTVKEVGGRVLVDLASKTARTHHKKDPHPLTRKIERAPGPLRVVGISTTVMDRAYPRFSTSEALLEVALGQAVAQGAETQLLRLDDLKIEHCRGYYSQSAHACTWPCSITQMDPTDQMEKVYEAFVHWADVILIATPIRWGAPSALYFKMVERMNCVQNQETIANRHLLRNKVAAFIITGGQDNVLAVAGQMLSFFAEVGCQFPQFPFVAHSRGWSAEDMENNQRYVSKSETLKAGTRALVDRALQMGELMVSSACPDQKYARGGRKAHALDAPPGR